MKTPSLSLNVTPLHNEIGAKAAVLTTKVCATIQACELDDTIQRAPIDIMVALDVSGSMTGPKLYNCKRSLELLLRQLTPEDLFGLVSFSDDAVIEVPTGKLSSTKRDAALKKIKSLQTRGFTNISASIGLAAQELFAMSEHNEVQSIFLLTDGQATCGVTTASGLLELTKACLGSKPDRAPISMHCFGYGSDHDDSLLRTLSSITHGGSYYFVQHDSAVASAFGDALGGILSVVAQNAVLNVSVPLAAREKGVKIQDVFHENKIRVDDWNYKISIGDFYSEESRDIMMSIALSTSELASDAPHVEVSISYMDTIQKTLTSSSVKGCHIRRPDMSSELSVPSDHVEVQWYRILAVQEMAEADMLSRQGRFEAARARLAGFKREICACRVSESPVVAQIVSDLDEVERGLQSTEAYAQFGSSTLTSAGQMHAMQRSNQVSANYYRSAKKQAMANFFSRGEKK